MNAINNVEIENKGVPPQLKKIGFGLLILGILAVFIAYFTDPVRAAFNNVILLMFFATHG